MKEVSTETEYTSQQKQELISKHGDDMLEQNKRKDFCHESFKSLNNQNQTTERLLLRYSFKKPLIGS